MRKLVLMPDLPLQVRYGAAGRGERLDSPSVEFGTTEPAQARTARVSWSALSPIEFSYLMAFWRTATGEGSKAFLIDLPFPGVDLIEQVACFEAGLRISGVSGGSASVDGTLTFIPRSAEYPLSALRADLIDTVTVEVA